MHVWLVKAASAQNLLFNEVLFIEDGGEGCPEHNGHSLEIIQDQQSDESLISEAGIPTIIVIGCHLQSVIMCEALLQNSILKNRPSISKGIFNIWNTEKNWLPYS